MSSSKIIGILTLVIVQMHSSIITPRKDPSSPHSLSLCGHSLPPSFSYSTGNSSSGSHNNFTRVGRIVGGTDCYEGEFPWMVSFKKNGEEDDNSYHFCGGFVISEHFVVSAAHCFLSYRGVTSAPQVTAAVGEFSLITPEQGTRDILIPVEKIMVHPEYTMDSRNFDIALIKLKSSVHEHPNVEPICLPAVNKNLINNKVATAGWGKSSFDQSFEAWQKESDALKKVDLQVWDTEQCRTTYKNFVNFPTHSFICAGVKGSQSCVGDSGGPLMVLEGTQWTAVGVVSVGQECGKHGRPSVYTDFASFVPWIKEILNSHEENEVINENKIVN